MMLTKSEIKKIAQEIVDESTSSGTPVKECVVVRIKDMDVNPEQIKRIVENVNVNSFLKKYEDASPDEKVDAVDFDVIDPSDVAQESVKESAMGSTKTASLDELWDYFGPPPGQLDQLVKEASHEDEPQDDPQEPSPKQKNAMFGYLKRAVEEMDQKIANAELDYLDGYNALKEECSRLYFNMDNFCKHAGAAIGGAGALIMDVLCKDVGNGNGIKTYQDGMKLSFYDKSAPGVRAFEGLIKIAQRRREYIKARNLLYNTRESLARKWGVL